MLIVFVNNKTALATSILVMYGGCDCMWAMKAIVIYGTNCLFSMNNALLFVLPIYFFLYSKVVLNYFININYHFYQWYSILNTVLNVQVFTLLFKLVLNNSDTKLMLENQALQQCICITGKIINYILLFIRCM